MKITIYYIKQAASTGYSTRWNSSLIGPALGEIPLLECKHTSTNHSLVKHCRQMYDTEIDVISLTRCKHETQ